MNRIAILNALCLMLAGVSAVESATVRGVVRYQDSQLVKKPIAWATIEVWYKGIYAWNSWAKVGEVTSDAGGFFSFSDSRGVPASRR